MTTSATAVCAACLSESAPEMLEVVQGQQMCAVCCIQCERCEQFAPRYERGNVYVTRRGMVAQWCCNCTDDHAWACDDCGDQYSDNVSGGDHYGLTLCVSCYNLRIEREQEEAATVIGGYHNSERRAQTICLSSEWTRRHGHRYLGVELEVERADDSNETSNAIAAALLDAANVSNARLLWAEHDGSLSDGFELITQPMGLDAQRELWARVLSSRAVRELRSHDTTTCGLHVHVSRTGLTRLQIAKVVVFLNDPRNENFVRAIARRYGNSYCKIKRVRMGSAPLSYDRYEMLNLTSLRTIEFRLFRGTLRTTTVLACVEFAHALLEWARVASCEAITWQAFVAWLYAPEQKPDTVNLRAYLRRRVTERMAPRYEALRALIADVNARAVSTTMRTPAQPTLPEIARWAEV